MGNWSYISRDELKLNFRDTATADDTVYRRVLQDVSELIDQEMNRTFRTYLATMVFTAKHSQHLDMPPGFDLLSITTLKTDEDDDYDYDNTWATTDYVLEPYNAPNLRIPYDRISTKPNGAYSFPKNDQGVQIVGKWGYFEELETFAADLNEALDASETGVDVQAGTNYDVLDTILIESEQMYVTGIASNTLTVVRGVNGTTAAAHSTGLDIKRYRYPGPIVEACGLQAARIFQRTKTPLGVQGSAEVGFVRVSRLDWDVVKMLESYRLLTHGAP